MGAILSSLMISCTSTTVSLDYQPDLQQGVPGPKTLVVGRFTDERKENEFYLGRVKTPVGTTVENLTTRVPIKQVVRNAFSHGLSARGMLMHTNGATHMLTGEILEFYADQVVRPAAEVRLRVSLVDTRTGEVVYRRTYEAVRSGPPFVPGSGNPVPLLNDLASRVLQDVVDEAIDDPQMRRRLIPKHSAPPPPPSYSAPGYNPPPSRPSYRDSYRQGGGDDFL